MSQDFRTPGQLIEFLLVERGWTQRILAAVMELSESSLNKLISGKQAVSGEIAIALEEVFAVPADRFLALQKEYDLASARLVTRPNPRRASRAQLFNGLPVAEMIKRGWIDVADVRDLPSVESALARFFGVPTVEEIEFMPHAAKRTVVAAGATPLQLAWLYRVRQMAAEMIVPRFTKASGLGAVEALKPLLIAAEEVRKVPRILAEAGIRFVIVESLPSAKIDGACFWLDDASPVIALSMRFDRIDNFWFVLRHELEHVLQGHGKQSVILETEIENQHDVNEEEAVANSAASEFCVPQRTLNSFIARKAPVFAERDILGVAAVAKVHPGLIAGQLRHRTGQFNRFNSHLVKVRSLVAPSAVVDGWGDVAPLGA